MDKNFLKTFITVSFIAILLVVISFINVNVLKVKREEQRIYKNEVSILLDNNDIESIDYDFILNDLNRLDNVIIEQLNLDLDIKKKTEYYSFAQNIYTNKINEIVRVLNDKLDDQDFEALLLDIDEFYKNIDFALEEIKNTNKSSIDVDYNSNKYVYEEKQKKCHELIENYKGFLKKGKV